MLSGAPSKGSELTAMGYCNTQTRSTRTLMVFGQHVAPLCQYSKTTALTVQDKFILHSLDALTSDIFVQDLVIARPFGEIAARRCFGEDEVIQLYKEMLFINFNKLFKTENLSAVMYSQPHLNYALTVSSWRHIRTAWKRKLKCGCEEIMELDRAEDVDASQAGHIHATENWIYGLSTDTLFTSEA